MATQLENHGTHCLGCGTDNPCSLGMVIYGEGEKVWSELTIDERHQGAPGFAHGGAIAAAFDDAFGTLLRLIDKPAVTVHLEIDYRKPWLLGTPHRIEAEMDGGEGRKLLMRGRALNGEGELVAESRTIFLIVGLDHFMKGVEHARETSGRDELPW